MVGEDRVTMSSKEVRRVHVIRQVMDRQLTQRNAGALLGLTTRQVRRLIQRVRAEGQAGVALRGRGRPSNRRIPEKVKVKALRLYLTQDGDFGPPWRRRSWPSAMGSRSVRRRCGAGSGRTESNISRDASARIEPGGRDAPIGGNWYNSLAPMMIGSRDAARDVP